MKRNKLTLNEYLIGNNENLIGSILGFQRGRRKDSIIRSNHFFSFLLYFDHRTGRIERYLINKGSTQEVNVIDKTKDPYLGLEIEHKDNKQIRNIYDDEHLIGSDSSFLNLYDGKMSRKFFSIFLLELLRDYLQFHNSYENGNMEELRNWTSPLIKKQYNDSGELTSLPLGTGSVKENVNVLLKDNIKPIPHKVFIDHPNKGPYVINVPKNFYNKVLFDSFLSNNFILNEVTYKIENVPGCLIDLKAYINSRTIVDPVYDLRTKVRNFNNNTNKILSKLKNKRDMV
jgi:hypothetical protein